MTGAVCLHRQVPVLSPLASVRLYSGSAQATPCTVYSLKKQKSTSLKVLESGQTDS
jgi:hypothetical protein